MSDPKTKRNNASVLRFIEQVKPSSKQEDCRRLLSLIGTLTDEKPEMWGDSIVGFGSYQYRYASGREGEWFLTGFSPRKQSLTIYIMGGFEGHEKLLESLGKHKTSRACLYLNHLDDADLPTLTRLLKAAIKRARSMDQKSD